MTEITPGLTHTSTLEVTPGLTAEAMGSGDMMAVAPHLDRNAATVGGHIDASHLKATPVGATVSARAVLTAVEGRKLTFEIEAREGDTVIGKATHLRFIVDRQKFMDGTK